MMINHYFEFVYFHLMKFLIFQDTAFFFYHLFLFLFLIKNEIKISRVGAYFSLSWSCYANTTINCLRPKRSQVKRTQGWLSS